jgi:hypothetical protein
MFVALLKSVGRSVSSLAVELLQREKAHAEGSMRASEEAIANRMA